MNLNLQKTINEFLKYYLNIILLKEVSTYINQHGGMRNGYFKRNLETLFGSISLLIPRVRNKDFYPSFLTKYKRQDESYMLFLLSLIKSGGLTKDITSEIHKLTGIEYSSSFIRKKKNLNHNSYKEFKNRSILKEYEAIFLDGTYVHINGIKYCIMFVLGMDENKSKTVLDFSISHQESKKEYINMLISLNLKD